MSPAPDPARRLQGWLAALPERLQAEVRTALTEAGAAMITEARRLLAESRGPQPSRPGTPPRDRAGRLAGSLSAALDETAARVDVAAAQPEAAFLEYGTTAMAPRPFLRPAGEAVRPAALAACRAALARAANDKDQRS